MRKLDTAAKRSRLGAISRHQAPAEIVCLALVLALIALFCRIASVFPL